MRSMDKLRLGARHLGNHLVQELDVRTDGHKSKPSIVYAHLTPTCNLKCIHCNLPRTDGIAHGTLRRVNELGTEDWLRVLGELRQWLGPFKLNISGGEPFVRKDLLPILEHACGLGILAGVVTNGTFIDEAMANRLVDMGMFNMNISLDGFHRDTHLHFRARQYDETMKAFDLSRFICRAASAECNVKKTADAVASAKTVAAVERLAKADRRLAEIEKRLESLPELYHGARGSRFGFHSETIEDQSEPHWVQIDLRESWPIDSIVLVPVHMPSFANLEEGNGFPLRFKIEVSETKNKPDYQVVVDHTASDFENPGRYPVLFPTPGVQGRYVRITSTKHVASRDGFIWAMEEMMILSGNYNIAAARPRTASTHEELFPN